MEKKQKTNPKIKLALSIAVPVMVMVVTIAMVGASFAWFSDQATAEIATINLTTKEVFTLVFETSGTEKVEYQGETAFKLSNESSTITDKKLYLINDYRALGIYGYTTGDVRYQTYMQDAPFDFKTTINLNTDDRYVDMTINFDSVMIDKKPEGASTEPARVLSSFGFDSIADSNPKSKIPLVFTWFMVKHSDVNPTTYYTPYGEMEITTVNGYQQATKLNGTSVTSTTSIKNLTPAGMTNFYTNGDETFDIYVVFCPEKLYWMQFFQYDRGLSVDEIYTTEEKNIIVSSGNPNQVYYSVSSYWGSTFTFAANMSVSRVDWDRRVSDEGGNV